MAGRVEGKVALVTGGASGIGRATALTFAREGAKLVIADMNEEGGHQTVHMITENGGEAIFVRTDVSQATRSRSHSSPRPWRPMADSIVPIIMPGFQADAGAPPPRVPGRARGIASSAST